MHRFRFFVVVIFIFAVLPLGLLAAPVQAKQTFGSAKLLHSLWIDAQLAGYDSDLARMALPAPDLRPPQRTMPLRQLPPVSEELQQVIRSVTPADGRKVVALTFDLCERAPHLAGYQKDIINYLRKNGIKATFFAGGKWMRSHPEKTLQLMADPLFELGNHAWTHGNLALMNTEEVQEQLLWTQAQYELLHEELTKRATIRGVGTEMNSVPSSLRLMRLPYGRNNQTTASITALLGLPMIQWSIEGEKDELNNTPDQLVAWNLKNIQPGAIILMQANAVPKKTQLLVPKLVPALQQIGYKFATVSEILEAGPVNTVRSGYFTKPGDNLYVDPLFGGKGTLGRK